jgi:hypothetical protein
MSSALLGGSTSTPLVSAPVAIVPVVATTLSAKQTLSIGPLGVGTVSVVETASAGGYTVSLLDSAGATLPVLTVTSTGGPPVTAATASYSVPVSHASALQSGIATIPITTDVSNAIAIPAITASSIVVVTAHQAAPDATATSFSVVLNAGVGFTIKSNANSTAAVTLGWFVAKY